MAREAWGDPDQPHGGRAQPDGSRNFRGDLSPAERKPKGRGQSRHESVRPRGEPPQPGGRHRLRLSAGNDSAPLRGGGAAPMIVDCHGHYTTAPQALWDWRKDQVGNKQPDPKGPRISDDEIRESLENAQLKLQRERGSDITFFSPRAGSMEHHVGDAAVSARWSWVQNDLIHRVCTLYPKNFAPVCMLPQSPGVSPENCVAELERCVKEMDFIGCNLNPDPSGGWWKEVPLTDRWWYPIYEKMVELDVPAMVHVSSSCNPAFHFTGAHYINADTTAFMQLIQGDLFTDFPRLRLIIPHGGDAVPYHWGRYRELADMLGKLPLREHVMENVFFVTCVYHQPGVDLLCQVIDTSN